MAGILWALPVTRLGLTAGLLQAAGMLGLAFLGSGWSMMILAMLVASAGQHLVQPVISSIALATSNSGNRGWRMGQVRAMSTAGGILGAGFVWLVFSNTPARYRLGFVCAAIVAGATGVIYGLMHIRRLHRPRARLVFRSKYWLYYLLELLFGARKQIFLTFGVWVLIQIYGQPAWSIAKLLMIAKVVVIVFNPLAGLAVDRFGEKVILIADGLILSVICLGYGYAMHMAEQETALIIVKGCFIADKLLLALGLARTTYASRLTDSPQEITSTLAMGVSINHLSSMITPVAAGAMWLAFGYERVFLAAAGLAVLTAGLSVLVPAKKRWRTVEQVEQG